MLSSFQTTPSPTPCCQEPPALRYLWGVACADAASETREQSEHCGFRAAIADESDWKSSADPFHADWAHW
jgi:hypothetical protein